MTATSDLVGKTVKAIDLEEDKLLFVTSDGFKYTWMHNQDCCENVRIDEVHGDLDDLIDSPLLIAEEISEEAENVCNSGTWTFYKFATVKGHVTIKWFGESNGYYSEAVDLVVEGAVSVIVDGLVTEFIAVMKRVGELEEGKEEEFIDRLEDATPQDEPSYVHGMETISVFFGDTDEDAV